jgi:hypothetical protein
MFSKVPLPGSVPAAPAAPSVPSGSEFTRMFQPPQTPQVPGSALLQSQAKPIAQATQAIPRPRRIGLIVLYVVLGVLLLVFLGILMYVLVNR